MATRAETLAELDQAYDRFRSCIVDLPEAAWHEQWLGHWTLAELLAHMTGWWREMLPAFERVQRGERPTPEGTDYSNPEPFNARFAATATPGPASLVLWQAAFGWFRQAVAGLPEELFGQNEQGRPRIGNRLAHGAGLEHFSEHQSELEHWLAGRRAS